MKDGLQLGPYFFQSRLILGTGKYSNPSVMVEAVKASGTQLITVALKRFNPERPDDDLLHHLSAIKGLTIMPNTSGAHNAREAIKAAHIARDLCGSSFIKVEIHPNPHHLMPDAIETYEAAKTLAADGFVVMPYIPPDPVLAKRLEEAGCASVMPLGSAIGSGRGLASAELLRLIIRDSRVPVIVDAGLRAPSEAAAAMEMGCDALLINSAIAVSDDPPKMAAAFAKALEAGLEARLAGLMAQHETAQATSPLTNFLSADK